MGVTCNERQVFTIFGCGNVPTETSTGLTSPHHFAEAPKVEQAKELAERKCPPGGMVQRLRSDLYRHPETGLG